MLLYYNFISYNTKFNLTVIKEYQAYNVITNLIPVIKKRLVINVTLIKQIDLNKRRFIIIKVITNRLYFIISKEVVLS